MRFFFIVIALLLSVMTPSFCSSYDNDVTVTRINGSDVFVEQVDRALAAKVTGLAPLPSLGATIHLVGNLEAVNHIRTIAAVSYTVLSPKDIKPLAMSNQSALQCLNGSGPDGYGLKLRTWGAVSKTTDFESGCYVLYLNYGDALIYRGEGQPSGLKVLVGDRQTYDSFAENQFVTLTGILDTDYLPEFGRNLPKLWLTD